MKISLLLFSFCILPQLFSLVCQKEMFPWSPFPMYAGIDSGKDLILLSAYLTDKKGHELPIERVMALRPKYEYRWRIPTEAVWKQGLQENQKEILLRFAKIFREDLAQKKRVGDFTKITFYLEHWLQFTGPQRYQPSERRVLLEYQMD